MAWKSIYIHDMNCVTPLGADIQSTWEALLLGKTGITPHDIKPYQGIFAGKIAEDLLEERDGANTHLERMLLSAATPIVRNHVPGPRTALILSTTKGNIEYLDSNDFEQARLSTLAKKIAIKLGVQTEPIVVSHACVSGILAVSVAKRLLQMDSYDDAIVIAGDVVSSFVVSGFQAFQAMSAEPCKPFDAARDGVSLGEAAACIYVSKERGPFKIAGEGAVNDANHISGPSRTGEGLYLSVQAAFREAAIDAHAVDYICAHGTATPYNDEMEAIAFDRLGLSNVPVNSLKGYFGHTLGASSLLELVIALKATNKSVLLPTMGFKNLGVSRNINVIDQLQKKAIHCFLKTSSGFGGSNVAILIEKTC